MNGNGHFTGLRLSGCLHELDTFTPMLAQYPPTDNHLDTKVRFWSKNKDGEICDDKLI